MFFAIFWQDDAEMRLKSMKCSIVCEEIINFACDFKIRNNNPTTMVLMISNNKNKMVAIMTT